MNAPALAGRPGALKTPHFGQLSRVGFLARGDVGRHRCLDAILSLADPEAGLPACFDLFTAGAALVARTPFDLVMACRRPVDRVSPQHERCSDELLRAGPPVLFLPYQPAPIRTKRVLLICDGSRSSMAAAQAARFMLRSATEVMLLDARTQGAGLPFERIATLVRDHAPRAQLDTTRIELGSAASVLETAAFARADYVVMGGYGRWNALPDILYGDVEAPFLRSRIPFLLGQ